MDLDLTDDQQLFHETTVRFIETELPITRVRELHEDPRGHEEKWLRSTAELGWFAMLVPEAAGGGSVSGHGVLDAAIVAESVGRFVQPGPFIPMNVVAATIAEHGSDEQRATLLPGVAGAEVLATWAPFDASGAWDGGAGVTVSGGRLSGTRGFVQDGQNAELILVVADDGQYLVRTDDPGVSVEPLTSLDLSKRFAEVTLVDVPGERIEGADLDRQLHIAVALSCAETVGALDAMFTMTVDYAKDRIAFGRPIGSFQAIKHVLADVGLFLEACKAMAVDAARAVDANGEDVATRASMAASFIGEQATEIAQQCLQVHGGIGYTWEHDLHLLMRRTRVNSALYGEPTWHRERLCAAQGL